MPAVAPQVLTLRTMKHTAGLLEELAKRRESRIKHPARPQKKRVGTRTIFQQVESYLQTLAKVPSEREMRIIVAAKAIQDRAEAMEISKHLQYKAVSMPTSVVTLDHLRKQMDTPDSTSEDFEKYIESLGPDLPEPLRENWREAVLEINGRVRNMDERELLDNYQQYLNWVLDRYAMDPAFLGGFNRKEPVPEDYEPRNTLISQAHDPESGIFHGWKYFDSFWNRAAQIMQTNNPEKPWAAAILFQPLAYDRHQDNSRVLCLEGLTHTEIVGLCALHDVPRDIMNEMISEGFSATWLASRFRDSVEEWGLFDTHLQALIWVCNIPQPKEPPIDSHTRRELTEEDHKVLEQLADEPAISTMPEGFARDMATLSFRTYMREVEREEMEKRMPPVEKPSAEETGAKAPEPEKLVQLNTSGVEKFTITTDPRGELLYVSGKTEIINDILKNLTKLSTEKLLDVQSELTTTVKYDPPEATRPRHKDPTYSIFVESTEPGKSDRIRAKWLFVHEGLWRERGLMLAGLCKLRGVFPEKSDKDTGTSATYTMPYSMEELHTIFGPFEEG